MTMPKVSVIIPVYNVEKYLGECLDSILGQTLKELEVLCVDDGSTDDSPKILLDYVAKDARVKLLSSPHAGAFRAREVGVKVASGEFIYFMDADDRLESVALERLCALCERENLDQVIFASSVFCESDVPHGLRRWARRMLRYYSISPKCCGKIMDGMSAMQMLLDNGCFHVSPPLRLIRATAVCGREYPFPDATTRADNYFTPVSLYYSKRCMAISARYYCRRVRNDSISTERGSLARHARNLLAVIIALYRFRPFRDDLCDQKTVLARFAAMLSASAQKRAWRLPAEDRVTIIAEALKGASTEECAFVLQTYMAAVNELRHRPKAEFVPMIKSLLRMSAYALWGRHRRRSLIS